MRLPALVPRSLGEVGRFIPLLLITCFLLLVVPQATAQAPNPYAQPNTNPDVPKNLHTWTQNVVIELLAATTCQLTGIDPVNPNQQCLGADPKTGKIGFVEGGGGVVGLMGNLIAETYDLPLSSTDYVRYLAGNFGVAKPAYAQGVGFQGLSPLIGIWSAFRNIVYLLLVVVFVIIGLAIMLRVKIDPRTVMTIQNQLPKIIIALILVTFSFAIAGFLVDLMWVTIYLVVNILSAAAPDLGNQMSELARAQHPFAAAQIVGKPTLGGFGQIIDEPAKSVGGVISQVIDSVPGGNVIVGFITAIFSTTLGSVTGGKILPALGKATGILKHGGLIGAGIAAIATIATEVILGPSQLGGFVGGIIAFLIIFIAVLWALFRLWFALIFAFVYILIDTVLAPFWILAGLIPGSSITFGAWLRHILANVIAFPTTVAMFLLAMVFISKFGAQQQGQFVPPLVGNAGSTQAIGALIGLGIILMTPQVVNILKEALKSPDLKYTAAIGQAIGVGAAVPMGTAKSIGTIAMLARGPGGAAGVARYLLTGQLPYYAPTTPKPGSEGTGK